MKFVGQFSQKTGSISMKLGRKFSVDICWIFGYNVGLSQQENSDVFWEKNRYVFVKITVFYGGIVPDSVQNTKGIPRRDGILWKIGNERGI